METKLQRALYQAAVRIFEEICFMFEAPELEEEFKDAQVEAAASVEFSGPIEGRLLIKARAGLLSGIAANMLGEENPSKKQQQDALGEIANIICGNILPAIHGSKKVFEVTSPQIVKTENLLSKEAPTATASVILDQGRADLMLYVHETVVLAKES